MTILELIEEKLSLKDKVLKTLLLLCNYSKLDLKNKILTLGFSNLIIIDSVIFRIKKLEKAFNKLFSDYKIDIIYTNENNHIILNA